VADFKSFPPHPVFRGVTPFKIDDGWLYRLRFAPGGPGVTPLLRAERPGGPPASPGGEDPVVAWAYERPGGGRSFSFTGGHLHRSLAEAGYRRFLVNGILWAAGVDVPAAGAPVALTAADLTNSLKQRPAAKE
jgi:hypothetical protein